MAADDSGPFFRSLVDIVQGLCRNLVDHSHCVEISGYICVEVDNWKKERYVLNEVLQRNGSAYSNSHCIDIQTASKRVSECCHGVVSKPDKPLPEMVVGSRGNEQSDDAVDIPVSNVSGATQPQCVPHVDLQQASSHDSVNGKTVTQRTCPKSKGVKRVGSPVNMLESYSKPFRSRHSPQRSRLGNTKVNGQGSVVEVANTRSSKMKRLHSVCAKLSESDSGCSPLKHSCRITEDENASVDQETQMHRGGRGDGKVDRNSYVHIKATPFFSTNVLEADTGKQNTSLIKSMTSPSTDVDMDIDDIVYLGEHPGSKHLSNSEYGSSSKSCSQSEIEPREKQITVPGPKKADTLGTVFTGKTLKSLLKVNSVPDEKVPETTGRPSSGACEDMNVSSSDNGITTLAMMDTMVRKAQSNTRTVRGQKTILSERCYRGKCAAERFKRFHIEKTGKDVDLFKTLPQELNMLLLEYLSEVKKVDGGDLKPRTLKGMFEYLSFFLKEGGYPCSITTDKCFQTSKDYIKRKREETVVTESALSSPIDVNDLEVLFQSKYFGPKGPGSLTNTMWFMNTQFLGVTLTSQHTSLKWGDICLKIDEHKREYLERPVEGTTSNKLYAKPRNSKRCFVSFYKQFRDLRPSDSLIDNAPFYLRYQESKGESSFLLEPLPQRHLCRLWRKLLLASGLPINKKISNTWTEEKSQI